MVRAKGVKVNREHKDRLFKLIFREKKDLLELYNAINDTDYNNPEDIEVNTLEDVVYMGMKNDLSFLIKDVLNLYEHQSTFSPNFPLRGLFYFSDLYRKIVGNNSDLYSSRLIELPTPQFVVFYNGTQTEPDRRVLRLSDAFAKQDGTLTPSLECTAVMININVGNNVQLLSKCRKLYEYSQFIGMIRENLQQKYSIEEALDRAVIECIEKGILADILSAHRQEVVDMILTEYNEELHLQREREIALEEGESRGEMLKLISQVRKKMTKSMKPDEIAEMLEEDLPVIERIYRVIEEHSEWEDTQVYEECCKNKN